MKNTLFHRFHNSGLHRTGSGYPAREAKDILEDIAQGVEECILLLSKDYKILWANDAATRQTKLSQDELIGNTCYKATHGSDSLCEAPLEPCPVSELLATGKSKVVEHQHFDKNGDSFIVEVSAYPVRDKNGEIVRFVHIAKDITERKKLEQEREKLICELQDALAELKTLKGIIRICASCKKIHRDSGSWEQIEAYIREHSNAEFSHSICPDCASKIYPNHVKNK